MQHSGQNRLAPLAGVAFVVLAAAAFGLVGGAPGETASAREVVAWYDDNLEVVFVAAFVAIAAVVLLLVFATALGDALSSPDGDRASRLVMAGAILAGGGLLVDGALHLAAVSAADEGFDGAVVTLNQLIAFDWLPMTGGLAALMLGAGVGALRARVLPRALAWAAVVIGIGFVTPIGFVAFLATPLWVLAVSVLLYRAQSAEDATPAVAAGSRA